MGLKRLVRLSIALAEGANDRNWWRALFRSRRRPRHIPRALLQYELSLRFQAGRLQEAELTAFGTR